MLIAVIWLTARALNRMDEERIQVSSANAVTAAIVASSQDAIIGKDRRGIITSWNGGAERIFGYRKDEILGHSASILVPQDHRAEQDEALNRVHSGFDVDPFDTVRLGRGGRPIDVALRLSPIHDSAGHVVGTSQVIRDISQRLAAERRFRLVFDASPSAMIMLDRHGRIALTNSQARRMFGYSPGELANQLIEVLIPRAIGFKHVELRKGYMESPEPRAMGEGRDLFAVRKNGEEFPVEIGLSPLHTGEQTFVLASVIDITARKAAEQSIRRQKDELARSNYDLEQFAYVASHDLQEPLRAVAGCVELLQRRYGDQLNSAAGELITHAVEGATRMRQLIDDLLAYSRVGRDDQRPELVDCNEALERALRNLTAVIRESSAEISHEALPHVIAKSAQVALVFQNLISNAIKFRREGTAPRITIDAQRDGSQAVISVRDNGIGISEANRERIFAIFQRLHTRSEYPGTGIGLALTKRIVERHGGRIWVETGSEGGAVFRFALPIAHAEQEAPNGD